jgi:hypothetical protein
MPLLFLVLAAGVFPGVGRAWAAAPVARDGTGSTNEDAAASITLSASDRDGDSLTYLVASSPGHGSVSVSGRTATYTPTANWFGTDTFTFKARDTTGAESAPATVTVTVTNVADAPTATSQNAYVVKNTDRLISLAGSDPDGDSLTCTVGSSPGHGSVTETAECVINYRPTRNYTGADSFTFTVSDGTYTSAAATVSINVAASNAAPVATNTSATTSEDTATTFTMPATDTEGDALTFAVATAPAHATTSISGNRLTYTPSTNWSGADTLTYTATDIYGNVSNVGTASLTVTAVNDAPTAAAKSATLNEDASSNVTLSASDVDSGVFTYAISTAPAHGTATISRSTLTYRPTTNWSGSDVLYYTAQDSSGGTSTPVAVNFTVNAVNDTPVANDQTVSAIGGVLATITLSATDVDSGTITYRITSAPGHGYAPAPVGNLLSYTPVATFTGTDTIVFSASDGSTSDTGTITISVAAPNHAPTVADATTSTSEDTAVSTTLSGSDSDGDPLTYSVVGNPTNGTVAIIGNRAVYTPSANFAGTDSYRFRANDGEADSNAGRVSITVNAVNDAPVAENTSSTINEDTESVIRFTSTDVDTRSGLTYTIVRGADNGSAVLYGGNSVRYIPDDDWTGTDTVQFTVNDGSLTSAVGTLSIVVAAVDDPPLAGRISANVVQGNSITVRAGWYDVEGDDGTVVLDSGATNGTVTLSGSSFRYTPRRSFIGQDQFTYHITSGSVTSNVATGYINVNPPATHNRAEITQIGVNKIQFGRDATDVHDLETSSWQWRPSTIRDWMDDMGVQAFRQPTAGDLSWAAMESEDDNFLVAAPNQIILDEDFDPLPTMFSLQYAAPTPPWCTDPAEFDKYMNDDSYDYLDFITTQYGDWVQWWELGNEMFHWVAANPPVDTSRLEHLPECYPLDGYTAGQQGVFLEEAGRFIQAMDDDAMIVLPSVHTAGSETNDWLTDMLSSTTGSDWFDVVNYHQYENWESYYNSRATLNETLADLGVENKLIKFTEGGSTSDPTMTDRTDYPNSDETQCSDVFRFFVTGMSNGDSTVVWHSLIGMTDENEGEGLPGMELITTDGEWKSAAYAMRLLAHQLIPLQQIADISRGRLYSFQVYTDRNQLRYVIWADGEINTSVPAGVTEMTSVYPNADGTYTWTPVTAGQRIPVTLTPILFR